MAQRAVVQVRARDFSSGDTFCCPSADVSRELLRLCDVSPLVSVDAGEPRHPLRARRERTSQQSVRCRVLGMLRGLAEAH